MAGISVVCFDWGGVILRICRSWAEGCAAAGLDVRGASATPEWAARRRPISRAYEVGQLTAEEFYGRMSESMDGLYAPAEIERVHSAWLIGEYPGMGEIIDQLNGVEHLKTALLSNTNASHWSRQSADPTGRLPHFPSAGRLKHRYASHLMGHAKPDAKIYEAFAGAIGHRGGEILFFDDLADNVATARSCGWNAEQIDHTGDTAAQVRRLLERYGIS